MRTFTASSDGRKRRKKALRRLLADEKDPADYLDEMFAAPVEVEIELLRRRQASPPRFSRPRRAV